jgi:hypothetical protein
MTNSVKFDPGIAKLSSDLYYEVYIVENDMCNMPQRARKARYFSVAYKKILKAIINNYAFYKGCLAWAYYIVNSFKDASLEGNPFALYTEEQKSQYAPTELVDFNIEYMDKFKSNLKYYNIQNVQLPEDLSEILNQYREFVSLNEGFINAKSVSDIQLPENLKISKSCDEIKVIIDKAIQSGNLEELITL